MSQNKVRWAVLGVARIATAKVVPAMQQGVWSTVVGIASRDADRARRAAEELGLPKAYASYEEALADPEVEAIYNPLPNHLHVPWSIRAAETGKHVLCEKPIGMSTSECRKLITVRDRTGVRIGEAFMVRTHPQWLRARELVRSGEIGELRAVQAAFGYFNRDPANVRNVAEYGGGAVMDIGCYPIQIARFLFGEEPVRVAGRLERDPEFQVDRLGSALLEFPCGHCVFTCGTQMAYHQRVQILGTKGRIEVQVPFNTAPDRASRLFLDHGPDLYGGDLRTVEIPACNQYTIQGDLFSRAVRGEGEVPTPLEDSLGNMAVIEAVFESARTGRMVAPAQFRS